MHSSQKHNAALGFYVAAWQAHTAEIGVQGNNQLTPEYERAHRNLVSALENYTLWQSASAPKPVSHPPIFTIGTTKLVRPFGQNSGMTILVVPSLINGDEILDITPQHSLLAYLHGQGLNVVMLQWGNALDAPHMNLADAQSHIEAAIGFLGPDISALGYCIGGSLLNLATATRPVCNQIFLGAPWHFQHDHGLIGQWARGLTHHDNFESIFTQFEFLYGVLPSIFVDHLFAGLNPLQLIEKFRNCDPTDLRFNAVENWLSHGRDLTIPMARGLFIDWMKDDVLSKSSIKNSTPSFLVVGNRDHISPMASCRPMTNTLTNHEIISHDSGHVGMIVGIHSQKNNWPRIVKFIQNSH